MATSNCATNVIASLINDKKGDIVSEIEATQGSADPNDDNIYICVDMGGGMVVCIRRPKEGVPVVVKA